MKNWARHLLVLILNREQATIDKDTGRSSLSEPHNSDVEATLLKTDKKQKN